MRTENCTGNENRTAGLLSAWATLVVLTLASFWFRDHGFRPSAAVVAILILTFVKVFLVGYSFMEIHRAPNVLRILFSAWCTATCAGLALTRMYLA